MDKGVIAAVIRHLITLMGGFFASRGAIGDSDIEALAGAATVIISIAWSIYEKWHREKHMEKEIGEAINRRAARGARKTDEAPGAPEVQQAVGPPV